MTPKEISTKLQEIIDKFKGREGTQGLANEVYAHVYNYLRGLWDQGKIYYPNINFSVSINADTGTIIIHALNVYTAILFMGIESKMPSTVVCGKLDYRGEKGIYRKVLGTCRYFPDEEAKQEEQAKLIGHCSECNYPVVRLLSNPPFNKFMDASDFDYWAYCSNKICCNHDGEGYHMDLPEFVN